MLCATPFKENHTKKKLIYHMYYRHERNSKVLKDLVILESTVHIYYKTDVLENESGLNRKIFYSSLSMKEFFTNILFELRITIE